MSWSFPPAGLTLAARTLGGNQSQGLPSSVLTVECPSSNPLVTLTCDINDEFTGSTSYDVGGLAAAQLADVYDWYTVNARFEFPNVVGVFSHLGVCQPADCPALEDGVSSGSGDWDMVTTGTGATVGMSGDDTGASDAGWNVPDTGPELGVLVVNPSPTYPIPDSDGNESGSVLFTRAQLEALTLTVDWAGTWHHPLFFGGQEGATFSVEISAYTGAPPSGWMCVL